MTAYILYGAGTVAGLCVLGILLLAGYIVCDYVVKRIKHERDKKWTDL